MTIVNPLVSSNLVIHATVASARPEERQNDLRAEQVVRATVVEGGLDRALLDLNQQRFRVQTGLELQTGQQLELQVLTTYPHLSFKLLTHPLESRLSALLPLLAKSFDWDSLLREVQKGEPPAALGQSLARLAAMLRPAVALPAAELNAMVDALSRLRGVEPLFSVENGAPLAAAFERVISVLSRGAGTELSPQFGVAAEQIRQKPELLQAFTGVAREKIGGLLMQLEQTQPPLSSEQVRQLVADLKNLLSAKASMLPQFLNRSTPELNALLSPAQGEKLDLSPAILGHLKELVDQLGIAAAEKSVWPRALQRTVQQIVDRVTPLVAEPDMLLQGGNLGLLSQLFGLNLEAELLRGRTREALGGLKRALLGARNELGGKGEEALHRIELFQICRVRLAEQGLLFVPLPLPFLEEGFLLVEDEGGRQDQSAQESATTQLSLHLRMSALGNLRIDMLAESSGLLLRIFCEDRPRMAFLQSLAEQLQGRLQDLPIRGMTFTTGVESPTRELLKKLVPGSRGMLDARI